MSQTSNKSISFLTHSFVIVQRHVVTAKLVRAVTSSCLIQRLKAHGYRNPDHSRALSKSCYKSSLHLSEHILVLVFLCRIARIFQAVPVSCRLAAPTDFCKGISPAENWTCLNSFPTHLPNFEKNVVHLSKITVLVFINLDCHQN